MKNILIVSPYFYPEGGGLENYAYHVAKELVKNNYRVVVISLSQNYNKIEEFDGIKVIRKKARLIISNTPIQFSLLSVVLKIIKSENIQLIHAHTPVPFSVDIAAIASKIKNIPLIVTYHSGSLYKNNQIFINLIISFYKIIEYFTLKHAKKIVVVSPHIKKFFVRWKNKIEIITPGVDIKKFNILPYPFKKNNLLFVGVLKKSSKFKGLDILLKAMVFVKKKFLDVKLIVVGGGDLLSYYKQQAKNLNITNNVDFLGQINYNYIPNLFYNSNILIVPSVNNEGCPNVLFEAMAATRPVIGTRIGGIPYIILESKCGKVVEPNNINELSEAIIYLLKNKKIAAAMGRSGRKLVEKKYTWEKIVGQYIKIYDEIFN